MEHMDDIFQCPQWDNLNTDNTKVRGDPLYLMYLARTFLVGVYILDIGRTSGSAVYPCGWATLARNSYHLA